MTPEQQFDKWFEKTPIGKVKEMDAAQKLHLAEQIRAVSRQMIANGIQKLTPENAAALRELDAEIESTRKRLRRK